MPPVKAISTEAIPFSMIKTFKLYHSVVNNVSYRSEGEKRESQSHCIFHYTVKGTGEVLYNGVKHKTRAGEGFFNIVNEHNSGYGYPEDATEPWEFVVICFDGGNVREIVKELMENKVIYKISNQNSFCVMLKRLVDEKDTDIKLTFFQKLFCLIYKEDNPKSQLSIKFQNIVERDILLNPTISAIANEINVSREHLHREYLKENNITPAKYLNHMRFEKLCYLLTTSMQESEISDMMNFPSLSGMTLFFKKNAGITPREYRKNGYISI